MQPHPDDSQTSAKPQAAATPANPIAVDQEEKLPPPKWLKDRIGGHNERLGELRDIANAQHDKVLLGCRQMLSDARSAGMALEEAFQLVKGTGGRWPDWVSDNFKGSVRTADVYRQVYKKWNDRRLVEARNRGFELKSIAAALKVLQAPQPDDVAVDNFFHNEIISRISDQLAQLDPAAVEIFYHNFGNLWQRLHDKLKTTVSAVTEEDHTSLDPDDDPVSMLHVGDGGDRMYAIPNRRPRVVRTEMER